MDDQEEQMSSNSLYYYASWSLWIDRNTMVYQEIEKTVQETVDRCHNIVTSYQFNPIIF